MPYPHYKEIELPLLLLIFRNGGSISTSRCYRPLGIHFGLNEVEMTQTLDDLQGHGGNRAKWHNMVQWARNSLAKDRLLARPTPGERGSWKISDRGMQKAASLLENEFHESYPDEVPNTVIEGARKQVLVNIYERKASARDKCIDHWGLRCVACDFDFLKQYGELGRGFIHIHHLTPLSQIAESYVLDPVDDLRPVCPNCHAMIHRTNPACSIEDLTKRIAQTRAA
jgi:5-methylcytosine-specific restriction protein A